jgi:hypothetical protein
VKRGILKEENSKGEKKKKGRPKPIHPEIRCYTYMAFYRFVKEEIVVGWLRDWF